MKNILVKLQKHCADYIKIITIFITAIFLLITITPIKSSAVTNYSINNLNATASLHCDGSQVYITSYTANKYTVIYPTTNSCKYNTITAEGQIKNIAVNDDNIYALSESQGNIILTLYKTAENTTYSYYFGNISINNEYPFAVCNSYVYIIEENTETISCYSIYGEKVNSFSVKNLIGINSYNNSIYIFTTNKVYTTSGYKLKEIACTSNIYLTANIHITANAICDYLGNIVSLENNNVISTGIEYNKINIGVINNYYCRYKNGTIYGYNSNGEEFILYKTNVSGNAQMCSYNNNLYLLYDMGKFIKINSSELNYPTIPTEPATKATNPPLGTNPNKKPNNKPVPTNATSKRFSIDNYKLDNSNNIIWDIPSSTTITEFKKNITLSGYTLEFFNNKGIRKQSGNIGTGFTVNLLYNKAIDKSYTLSVTGDLNGDGKITTGDTHLICDYLMKNVNLNQPQLIAGDVNKDNIINGVDVLKITRNNL